MEILENLSKTLLVDLKQVYDTWDYKEGIIGKTMADFANYFQLYRDYCNNTETSQQVIAVMMKNKKKKAF